MPEYNLNFKDLKEGEIYEAKSYKNLYSIKNGLLFNNTTNQFSLLSVIKVSNMQFKKENRLREKQKAVLRLLNKSYPWIAKDKNGDVWVFFGEPIKDNNTWKKDCAFDYEPIKIPKKLFNISFDFLSWEDVHASKISDLIAYY